MRGTSSGGREADRRGDSCCRTNCSAGTRSGASGPPRGPFYGNFASWVLTRLHTRYDRSSLSEDLLFREAKPVAGGRATVPGLGDAATGAAGAGVGGGAATGGAAGAAGLAAVVAGGAAGGDAGAGAGGAGAGAAATGVNGAAGGGAAGAAATAGAPLAPPRAAMRGAAAVFPAAVIYALKGHVWEALARQPALQAGR